MTNKTKQRVQRANPCSCLSLSDLPLPPAYRSGWPWIQEELLSRPRSLDGKVWPKITVVTPSYNQAQFLEETIRSVLLQGYPNLEYMVMDGGSTDDSLTILEKYSDWLAYWTSEPDRGQANAINKGWYKSTGDILCWLNSDDTYCPGALYQVADAFESDDTLIAVIGECYITDINSAVIGRKPANVIDPIAMVKNSGGVPGQPAIFIKRSVVEQLGGLDERLQYVFDWEYWIRIGLNYPVSLLQTIHIPIGNSREWQQTKTSTGGKIICDEHRLVLSDLFNGHHGPRFDEELRNNAVDATYWKQANLQYRLGDITNTRKSLAKIWKRGGYSGRNLELLVLTIKTMIPPAGLRVLRRWRWIS